MSDFSKRGEAEAAIKACYSTWAADYHDNYYTGKAPYPPVHRDIVRRVLVQSGARTLLDAGCGPASMLRDLADLGIQLYGFDLTPEMVEEARRVMAPLGMPAERIWEGSVVDRVAFRARPGGPEAFDAAICIGVLPHVPEELDDTVIGNLRDAVRPGGLVAIEARNQLFALFTLNRYSYRFVVDELIRRQELERSGAADAPLERIFSQLAERFRMDLPPVRGGKVGEPGYDEVLSRTHNPLVLKDAFAGAGFRDVQLLFYHYHCLPPMFEAALPDLFRERSLAMEDPSDWRGHFMASAFIVVGKRA
jgi:2-polyprenyl-3-methyl-5-hydroxy-6-metoxy-1,4-benzoquinol methylase